MTTLLGQRFPNHLLTCYFCMSMFVDPPEVNAHWEVCEVRKKLLSPPDYGFHYIGLRAVRNLVGEVVFASEWKRLMETPPEHDDDEYDDGNTRFRNIVGGIPHDVNQYDAHLAASFITWLGTNCGGAYLHEAKRLAKEASHTSTPYAYLGQWAMENYRRLGVNSGERMVEHFVRLDNKLARPNATEYEVIEHMAYWLGTNDGQDFLTKCERLIEIRKKVLSDEELLKIARQQAYEL